MCLIWLNMDLFSWRFVLGVFLSLQDVMTWTLLHFLVSFWIDIDYTTCFTGVGCFMLIFRIQTFVRFISGTAWFHGLLFVYWEIYGVLWCSQYCDMIPIVVPLGEKLIWTSNISSLMKGWSERSIFNVGRVEVFVPSIIPEPGDHPLPIVFLWSSNFAYEKYLILLVCGYHYYILSILFV